MPLRKSSTTTSKPGGHKATCNTCGKTFSAPKPHARNFGSSTVKAHHEKTGHGSYTLSRKAKA